MREWHREGATLYTLKPNDGPPLRGAVPMVNDNWFLVQGPKAEAVAAEIHAGLDAIQVWPFHEAPEEYRKLTPHGGDEDWLALLPARYKDRTPLWMEIGPFGACDTSLHELPDGRIVAIGAHA